jgi:hypothetical protein
MWDLLGEEDSRTPIKLSTIKERFGQEITRELLRFKSGFLAVWVRIKRADGFFNVFIDVRVVAIVCI